MKNNRTKICLSIVTIVVSVFLLLGSTFAWFTDSVSNTGNRIQAGTLEVDLLMHDGSDYKSIADGSGDIFDEADVAQNSNESLWEPGKTQTAFLAIQNKGNLAVKYSANIVITDGGLAGALEYAFLPGVTKAVYDAAGLTTWADVEAYAATNSITISPVAAGTIACNKGVLDEIVNGTENETEYFALVVHMNEDAGNEYQGKDITIDVSINATQYTAEEDGFGSNEYDALTPWLGGVDAAGLTENTDTTEKTVVIKTADQLAAFAASVNGGNKYDGYTVKLENDIDLNNMNWTPIGIDITSGNYFNGIFDGNGKTVSNLYVNAPSTDNIGLFGAMYYGTTIKNLTINNVNLVGQRNVGAVVGLGYTGNLVDNKVTGTVKVEGNYHVGGISGYGYADITNCDIDAKAGSYVKGVWLKDNFEGDAVGGVVGYAAEGSTEVKNCDVKGVAVSGSRKVGGIVGQTNENAVVDTCTFDGTVECTAPTTYATENAGKLIIGGIVGEQSGNPLTISNCTVKGTITGVDSTKTGKVFGGSRVASPVTNLTNNNDTNATVVIK